jgi:hypothetical protein
VFAERPVFYVEVQHVGPEVLCEDLLAHIPTVENEQLLATNPRDYRGYKATTAEYLVIGSPVRQLKNRNLEISEAYDFNVMNHFLVLVVGMLRSRFKLESSTNECMTRFGIGVINVQCAFCTFQ